MSNVEIVREFWGRWRNDGFDKLLAIHGEGPTSGVTVDASGCPPRSCGARR